MDRGGSSTVIDFTGPQPSLDDAEPAITGRRTRHRDHLHDTSDEPGPGRGAARRVRESATGDAAEASRSRRRVAWRKGSDVDAELWPAAAFGGVSDEQFWDDLAADKPLATTARTAQPGTAAGRRPPSAGPLPDLYPADDRGRGNGSTQPSPTLPAAAQPYPTATQPSPAATQPVRPARQPAESRERSRPASSADEDPLTSPAYSLRPKGSAIGQPYPSAGGGYADSVPAFRHLDQASPGVNGRGRSDAGRSDPLRSNGYRYDPLRSDPLRPNPLRFDPLRPDPLRSSSGYGASASYPYPQPPYSEPAQTTGTAPYGERYGYGNPAGSWVPASPGSDPRRANGGWNPSGAGGNGAGDGYRGARPAYPSANRYRAPYRPRGYDRPLSSLR